LISKVVRAKAGDRRLFAYSLTINLSILLFVHLICKFEMPQSYFTSFISERLPLRVRRPPFTFLLAI
jgi:hypothetical protein